MLDELLHGGQIVRQAGGIAAEVVERDEGVGLAPAVGQLKLAHRFVVPAGEAQGDVARQVAQRDGGIGEGEERAWVLVDWPRLAHDDVVEVGGEDGERELAGAHVLAQLDDLVPGGPGERCHVSTLPRSQGAVRAARHHNT